ncbi:MAG: MazG family protein [Johnsonella sp.]|nr:MazG family protein [Johnsonella sp.]
MKHNHKEYIEKSPHDFEELREIVAILRSENGCKWDRAQTHESLKECLENETKEVYQAIDQKDDENLCEELGDLLLQVLLNAQIASERGAFTLDDVIQNLSEKMIRRHPHVFGDMVAETPEESLALWREIKRKEKEEKEKRRKERRENQ